MENTNAEVRNSGNVREVPSDEATREGLRLAKEAGDAQRRMVEYFINNVAADGAVMRAGDYLIGLAVEDAEPLYHVEGADLHLAEPCNGANAHIEVVVLDAGDGRFLPALDVTVTLSNSDGEIGTYELPFLWHPTMYHYGRNIRVPEGGRYGVKVAIAVPRFPRHDKVNGKRYTAPESAIFKDMHIKLGRK